VNFETLNGDYNVQLKARITAGTAPDVMYINSDHIRDYETTGALKNLSFLKSVKGLGFPSEFYSNLQAGYTLQGRPVRDCQGRLAARTLVQQGHVRGCRHQQSPHDLGATQN